MVEKGSMKDMGFRVHGSFKRTFIASTNDVGFRGYALPSQVGRPGGS